MLAVIVGMFFSLCMIIATIAMIVFIFRKKKQIVQPIPILDQSNMPQENQPNARQLEIQNVNINGQFNGQSSNLANTTNNVVVRKDSLPINQGLPPF